MWGRDLSFCETRNCEPSSFEVRRPLHSLPERLILLLTLTLPQSNALRGKQTPGRPFSFLSGTRDTLRGDGVRLAICSSPASPFCPSQTWWIQSVPRQEGCKQEPTGTDGVKSALDSALEELPDDNASRCGAFFSEDVTLAMYLQKRVGAALGARAVFLRRLPLPCKLDT